MHNFYIAEIYRPSSICLLLILWVHLYSLLHSQPCEKLHRVSWCITVVQGHQNLYHQKAYMWPPISFHCYYMYVLLSFTSYDDLLSKIKSFWSFIATLVSFEVYETRSSGLPVVKLHACMVTNFESIPVCDRQMDRQINRQMDRQMDRHRLSGTLAQLTVTMPTVKDINSQI